MSAPARATVAAAERMMSGSWPKSWTETGPPSRSARVDPQQLGAGLRVAVVDGEARHHLRHREPGAVALGLQAHEPVADPGQRREHDPVGDRQAAEGPGVAERAHPRSLGLVALPDQAQAREREQVVDVVDRLAVRHDLAREPARRDRLHLLAELARAGARGCRRPCRRSRRPRRRGSRRSSSCRSARAGGPRSIFGSAAARSVSASIEISTPGKMIPPRYSPSARDDVVGDGGAEVDDRARAAELLVARDRVDEPVGPDLARVVVADRHPGLEPGTDDARRRRRGSARPSPTHSGRSAGTVEETIIPSSISRCMPRSASRLRSTAPSSSAVDSRTVAKRQCWTSSPSRKVPRWVCVLPASTARSMGAAH